MGRQWSISITAIGAAAAIGVILVVPVPAGAAPVRGAGHVDMAWTVTDRAGSPPPNSFGAGGNGRWAGADRVWHQPGFTGSYRIRYGGVDVAGYCGDFHNAKSPDAASTWKADRSAFAGSDKALAKLSYAQWRWGATTDPDTAAAMNLYTHFLGSPGDRSHRSGVPIPDINDNDVLDEVVKTLPPHAGVAPIMYAIDARAEAWSAAFGDRTANIAAGLTVWMIDGAPVVTSTATGRRLPAGSADVTRVGRAVTATTAGVAVPLRDATAGSQNSIVAGAPQTARLDIAPVIVVTSQISDSAPSIGSTLSDAIAVSGLLDGETATVRVELFDLATDPTGAGAPLAVEQRAALGNGSTARWASFEVTAAVAGHRLGYRHRLVSIDPPAVGAALPGAWSELGIADETGTVERLSAEVHLRATVSSDVHPLWINAQRDTQPGHRPAAAPTVAADGSHDDGAADPGDALPVYGADESVSFRYEVWLDAASTGDVTWGDDAVGARGSNPATGTPEMDVVVDDAGTEDTGDDFRPTYVEGDDGDGRLSVGEVWVYAARGHRRTVAGEHHRSVATIGPGRVAVPMTGEPTGDVSAARIDPVGYAVPCVSTSVADAEDGDRVVEHGSAAVVDTATFCNLVPGETYVIDAVVVDRATGEPTRAHGSTTFVPDAPEGTVDVEILVRGGHAATMQPTDETIAGPVLGKGPAAGVYVVFETVKAVASGDVVAVHADLDDPAQTFTVRVPDGTPSPSTVPAATVPPTTVSTPTDPPITVSPTTTPPTTMAADRHVPPTTLPTVTAPPSLPRTGGDVTTVLVLAGLLLVTAGAVVMEARHGRVRRVRE